MFAPGVTQRLLQIYSGFAPSSLQLKCCCCWVVPFSQLLFLSRSFPSFVVLLCLHKSPCRLSYLLMMFLQRPSSFLMSATSCRRVAFSRSRKAARTEIWFSFSRRASRERLAASLFFKRRLQYFSSCWRRRCGMLGCMGGERWREERKEKEERVGWQGSVMWWVERWQERKKGNNSSILTTREHLKLRQHTRTEETL